jgi:hypothetical protein
MYQKIRVLVLIIILGLGQNTGFAQCTVTSTYTENFNNGGATNMTVTGTNNGVTGSENAGDLGAINSQACRGQIINSSQSCNGTDTWKTNTSLGATAANSTGADGGSASDYAFFVDPPGNGAFPNPSRLWCYNITVAAGDIFDFSALYSSPWMQVAPTNDPVIFLTINGITIAPGSTVNEWNTGTGTPMPYNQQQCAYTIPAGTSGSVPFCINMTQYSGGSVGKNSQGNDLLVDDIVIKKISGVGCSGPAPGSCAYTALPVTLESFSVRKDGNYAALQWMSTYEQNSSYFSIEKSDDATYFTEIGTVNAQGNSSNLINYFFEDNNYNSTSYYRLKMIDKDGSYKYSTVIVLTKDVYATVISQMDAWSLEIKATVTEDTQWNLSVYSLLGQQYFNERIALKKGENTIVKEISGKEESAKIIRLTSSDGTVILCQVAIW